EPAEAFSVTDPHQDSWVIKYSGWNGDGVETSWRISMSGQVVYSVEQTLIELSKGLTREGELGWTRVHLWCRVRATYNLLAEEGIPDWRFRVVLDDIKVLLSGFLICDIKLCREPAEAFSVTDPHQDSWVIKYSGWNGDGLETSWRISMSGQVVYSVEQTLIDLSKGLTREGELGWTRVHLWCRNRATYNLLAEEGIPDWRFRVVLDDIKVLLSGFLICDIKLC
ncbi:RING/U-box protein, partial [Striga asiatica]